MTYDERGSERRSGRLGKGKEKDWQATINILHSSDMSACQGCGSFVECEEHDHDIRQIDSKSC